MNIDEGIRLEPVRKPRVTEVVAKSILSLIRDGSLKPGDKLPSQKELETMLKVSRPSLREALAGLVMLGYIEAHAGQGYFVCQKEITGPLDFSRISTEISDEELEHLYEARAVLEKEIAGLAAARATPEEVRRLHTCVDRIEEAVPSAEALTEGLEFHRLVAEAAKNPVLRQIEMSIIDRFTKYLPFVFTESTSHERDVLLHRKIVECIEKHDRAAAVEAAYQHIQVFSKEIGIEKPATE
jgi:GntR family transcriptional repressor for pyruvate dehydrogenase complex